MSKILVIEDEKPIRDNIEEILQWADFDTIIAENGRQGVQLAKEQKPDLIICDLMMPELDGYSVLTLLHQDITTAAIPLIFLTAKATLPDIRRGMELGADDYLTKPFQMEDLLQSVNTRLKRKTLLEKQNKQNLDKLRNCISRSLPHEINTPLNCILGMSQFLIDDYYNIDKLEAVEMLSSIHQSAIRLHRLMINFLLYAELELIASNHQKIEIIRNLLVKTPTRSVINYIAFNIAQRAGRTADLKLKLSEAEVKIPESRLTKVLEEIIDNAFKFSTINTPVEIVSDISNNEFNLSIIDYGRGMTQEQIYNIGAYAQFERKCYEQQGSGLGLIIAKRIVELHGGSFTIDSLLKKRTMIYITLPIYSNDSN